MPYISPEEVKEKRNEIKKAFPSFKFSITCRNYSTIDVVILAAPIRLTAKEHETINPYYIHDHFTGEAKDVLQRIKDIAAKGRYTESEDGDYGTIPSFYVGLKIGDWDKPFIYTGN